jgi:hypothetical protein
LPKNITDWTITIAGDSAKLVINNVVFSDNLVSEKLLNFSYKSITPWT